MRLTPALILLSMAVALGLAAPALAETAAAGEAPAAAPVAGAPAAAPVAAPVAEVLPASRARTCTRTGLAAAGRSTLKFAAPGVSEVLAINPALAHALTCEPGTATA